MSSVDALIETANRKRKEFVRHRNTDFFPTIQLLEGTALQEGCPPELSITVPTLKGSRRGVFQSLLEQIKKQSLQNYELIIVEGDPRQGRAINTGAALARADLVLTLDDDTVLGHERVFETLIRTMKSYPDIGLAGTSNLVPEDAPWLVRTLMKQVPRRSSERVHEITDSDMAEHPCLVIRKSVFFEIGGENELIPRGLDPYLRAEVRKAGYRVVVVPDTWIHHLPPNSLPVVIRQFFRNGSQAAFCKKLYPQWVIETPDQHVGEFKERIPFSKRLVRYAGRILLAVARLRLIYLLVLFVYALGYIFGFMTTRVGQQESKKGS